MTASGSPSKGRAPSATAEQILDLAETLIQTRSYSAFSYQDISDALGLTKGTLSRSDKVKLGRLEAALRARTAPGFG